MKFFKELCFVTTILDLSAFTKFWTGERYPVGSIQKIFEKAKQKPVYKEE
ncbi:hypothetical protein [Saccharicrinis sp. 156]